MSWFKEKKKFVRPLPAGKTIQSRAKKILVMWKIFAVFSFSMAIAGWTLALILFIKDVGKVL